MNYDWIEALCLCGIISSVVLTFAVAFYLKASYGIEIPELSITVIGVSGFISFLTITLVAQFQGSKTEVGQNESRD